MNKKYDYKWYKSKWNGIKVSIKWSGINLQQTFTDSALFYRFDTPKEFKDHHSREQIRSQGESGNISITNRISVAILDRVRNSQQPDYTFSEVLQGRVRSREFLKQMRMEKSMTYATCHCFFPKNMGSRCYNN